MEITITVKICHRILDPLRRKRSEIFRGLSRSARNGVMIGHRFLVRTGAVLLSIINYGNNVSAPSHSRERTREYRKRRRNRYELRDLIRPYTQMKSLRACGNWPYSNEGVDLHLEDQECFAYYKGLQSCKSPWVCPVCAAKIRQGHAADISEAALAWMDRGGSLYSMMFTFPHNRLMRLGDSWTMMNDSFRALLAGRRWRRLKKRFGIAGFVRSTEATCGENGWHPHIHILLFLDSALTERDLVALQDAIYNRWASYVRSARYGMPKRELFKIFPVRSASAVCEYLVKARFFEEDLDFAVQVETLGDGSTRMRHVGLELARSDLKVGRRFGRTPFQIIGDYCDDPDGRKRDLGLWYTWEEESKGKRSVEWSRGYQKPDGTHSRKSFKKSFGLEDKTDEQMAEQEVGAAKLIHFSNGQFQAIRICERVLDVLELVEAHGPEAGPAYVESIVNCLMETGDLTAVEEFENIIRRIEVEERSAATPTRSDIGGTA